MGKILRGNDDKKSEAVAPDVIREFELKIASKLGGSNVHIGRKITKGKNLDLDAVE